MGSEMVGKIGALDAFLAGVERNTGAFKKGVAASWQTNSEAKEEAEAARRGYDNHRIAVRAGLLVRAPWTAFEFYVDHGTLIHALSCVAHEVIDPDYDFPGCP